MVQGMSRRGKRKRRRFLCSRSHSVGRRSNKMTERNNVTVMEAIMHRRAIRRYDPRQIEESDLQQILEAGMYAPSAGGRQGVIFAVCQDREVNEKLGKIKRANSKWSMASGNNYISKEQPSVADDPKLTNAFYDAPTVITMFAPKNFLFSAEDCATAAENMMLAADALGVGSCYIGQGWTAFADPYGQEILKKWNIRPDFYAVMQAPARLSERGRQTSRAEARAKRDAYSGCDLEMQCG